MKKCLLVVFLLISSFANAEEIKVSVINNPEGKAIAGFIKDFADLVVNTSSKKISNKAKSDIISGVMDDKTDIVWMSRFVAGKYYRQMSEIQLSRFSIAYKRFLVSSYLPKLNGYNGKNLVINDVFSKGNSEYLVKATAKTTDKGGVEKNIALDFMVRSKDGKYFIFDVIGEGVSLIITQRSDFTNSISQVGTDTFIGNLEKKVKEFEGS